MSKFIFSRIHFLPKQTFSRSPPSICVSNIIYTLARFPPFLRVSAESFVPGHPPPAMGSRNPFIRPSHNLLVLVFARPPVLTHSSTTNIFPTFLTDPPGGSVRKALLPPLSSPFLSAKDLLCPNHSLFGSVSALPPLQARIHSSTNSRMWAQQWHLRLISSVSWFSFFLPSCSAPSPPSLPPWCFIYPPHVYLRSVFIHCFHHAMRSFRSPPLSV